MSPSFRSSLLPLTGLAAATFGLSACSSTATAGAPPNPPPTSPTSSSSPSSSTSSSPKTIITGETLRTETPKPPPSTTTTTSGGSGTANSGFDGPAFQKAMAALGVPATSGTAGSATSGAGTSSYTLDSGANGIGRIDCFVKAEGGTPSQSDQDALSLASPYLQDCGSFTQTGSLKAQATQYVTTNLPTLQGESMVTTTVGAIQLKVGRQGPGSYFVTIINGG